MGSDILEYKNRLTEEELATYWGVARYTLQKWRYNGQGPMYIKIGGKIRYTKEAIIEYEKNRVFLSTSKRVLPKVGQDEK